jgi:hypothetical protein
MTFVAATKKPDLWKAAVAWVGITDLHKMYEKSMEHFKCCLREQMGDPVQNADLWRDRYWQITCRGSYRRGHEERVDEERISCTSLDQKFSTPLLSAGTTAVQVCFSGDTSITVQDTC